MTAGSISRTEFDRLRAANMTEQQLQACIVAAARRLGWIAYHTHDSRRSEPGFPDLVLVRGRRVVYRELKTQTGRIRPEQRTWLYALEQAGADTAIWRPIDWFNDTIANDLQEERR